jgi:hypothetical protein
MSEIVERLRAWVYTDSQYATAREAADEIERLRSLLSRTGTIDAKTDEAATECRDQGVKCPERECLTDAERKAITEASDFYVGTRTGVTLRGLLARLSPPAT